MAALPKRHVAIISVVPSPYQRDLFASMHAHPLIDLQVYYLEAGSPDSPWPEKPLADYEKILPGFWFSLKGARIHCNWSLPDCRQFDVVVVNTLMSITAQWLTRVSLRGRRWIFLGERLGRRQSALHTWLAAPLHGASAIAAIGTWAERDYHERFPEPKMCCLPYCCELSAFLAQPRHQRTEGELVFLFCGQMIARKGVDQLLRAFAKLERGRLLLVGREAELPEMLSQLPESVHSRIHYAGFQAPEALPQFFAQADVFVLPSRYDGWGVVVNQAIGAGLPIICSDQVGAGYDLVESGVNGLRFEAGSEQALFEAMRQFVEHPEWIEPWGAVSREKARRWVPEIAAERWAELIQSVAST